MPDTVVFERVYVSHYISDIEMNGEYVLFDLVYRDQ